MIRGLKPATAVLFVASFGAATLASAQQSLEPRLPGAKMTLAEMQILPASNRVIVKFREGLTIRRNAAGLTGLTTGESAAFAGILQSAGVSMNRVRRQHAAPEAELDRERVAAEQESGRELADLNLYYVIDLPAGVDAAALASRLNTLPAVEFAEPGPEPRPLPVDIAPPTPNFTAAQGYKKSAPQGVGALEAAGVPGGDGKSIRFVDIEYSWQLNHEDLTIPATRVIAGGATGSDPFGDTNHGTAVLGEIVGLKNVYGVTGIAPKAIPFVAPANTAQFGYDPARAIGLAKTLLVRGEVIVIEQQWPVCGGACGAGQVGCGPLEWRQDVFDTISQATAKNIVVVEAAGNGNVNLDAPACGGLFQRNVRNSRAIIVGAGSSTNHSRLSFSSYGSRVDVQGWGENVTTTGYGDAFNGGGDIRQRYTSFFGGTSSATPIVSGAALAMQGVAKACGKPLMTPTQIRSLMITTGTPQAAAAGNHIGPLPRIRAALNAPASPVKDCL